MCACINVFIWVYVCVCVCVCVCVGLCSYEDPEKALREMARVCKTEQQGGRILLLEHGRSWLWPVNVLLDRSVITKLYITFITLQAVSYSLSNSFIFPVSVASQRALRSPW
jgi:ubiquinone/menaquinone biosynthesis C-methylase UbiE